tara:strand:+ start:373 stop:585 length:213 start_codon:yes stop_codon:yes gene_type:complete
VLTRSEVTAELRKRGYVEDDYPGVWRSPNGDKLAWFIALKREGLNFDSKTWGKKITQTKEEWKRRKKCNK